MGKYRVEKIDGLQAAIFPFYKIVDMDTNEAVCIAPANMFEVGQLLTAADFMVVPISNSYTLEKLPEWEGRLAGYAVEMLIEELTKQSSPDVETLAKYEALLPVQKDPRYTGFSRAFQLHGKRYYLGVMPRCSLSGKELQMLQKDDLYLIHLRDATKKIGCSFTLYIDEEQGWYASANIPDGIGADLREYIFTAIYNKERQF